MTKNEIEKILAESICEIKPDTIQPINHNKSLVKDYGFESLDIIDLLFEVEKKTNISIDLTEVAVKIGAIEGRRFNDLTIAELLTFLYEKANL